MTQQERTELIREMKELLQLQQDNNNMLFDKETIELIKVVLQKCLTMSII